MATTYEDVLNLFRETDRIFQELVEAWKGTGARVFGACIEQINDVSISTRGEDNARGRWRADTQVRPYIHRDSRSARFPVDAPPTGA